MSTEGGRPDPFDGKPCNTAGTTWGPEYNGWMCDAAYEAAWGSYMSQVVTWLQANVPNYATRSHGFWNTVNEPQVWVVSIRVLFVCSVFDSDLIFAGLHQDCVSLVTFHSLCCCCVLGAQFFSFFSKQARAFAPGLKVAVSREAHPWVYARGDALSCGYDIWIGHINRLQLYRTWNRQDAPNFETSWMYFLDTDAGCHKYPDNSVKCSPYLAPFISKSYNNAAMNPIATNDGMHYRSIPWVLFSMRISGWLYYKDDSQMWDDIGMNTAAGYQPPRPRVSAALMREGLEDYEYLYAANCNQQPKVFEQAVADAAANSIGYLFASWRNTANAEDDVVILRHELGLYLEGTRPDIPFLVQPKLFPFADYFIDFAPDPTGTNPTFSFGGLTWMKVDFAQK